MSDEHLERRVRQLETRLERLERVPVGSALGFNTSASSPPTDSEIDATFGTDRYTGFTAAFYDTTSPPNVMYLVVWDGSSWHYVELTQAV